MKKIFDLKALDVDQKNKKVKVAIAEMKSVDHDNDLFDSTAFDRTIKERGPNGTKEIWHLLDHTQKSFSALSKFSELSSDGNYVIGVSQYKNSFAWREVAWPLYEAGDITQHSVGFEILKDEKRKDGVRVIKEVRLYEGSAVLWGANPNTPTMQVVKSLMNLDDDRDITAAEKIDEIIKSIYKGRFDEDQSLIIVELKRLQYLFDTKQTAKIFTEPETTSTLPESMLNVLQTFTQNLKADGRKTITGTA
jgi:HK97 family phage prohead protease